MIKIIILFIKALVFDRQAIEFSVIIHSFFKFL